ncbi:MAG: hypothetical protein JJU36_07510 [Phycisphaeraceae bacterium]|nr:hypothetical protein [Phycisphaeraceae bacterium]
MMKNTSVTTDDRSVTHLSLARFDADRAAQRDAEQLVVCLKRNDAVPEMRQHIALPVSNREATKRLLAMARSEAFVRAWEQSVQSVLTPSVHAIWTAWRQQRGTDREHMRRLRQVFRIVNQLRDCFPLEVVRE